MRFIKFLFLFFCLNAIVLHANKMNSFEFGLESFKSSKTANTQIPIVLEKVVDSLYVLGPGDFLDLLLEDELMSLQVYADGSIAIEDCGVVQVAGRTLSEARELILNATEKKYKREESFVQLAQMKKFIVRVMGAVRKVGQVLLEPQTRLSMLLDQVGLVGNSNKEKVLLIRDTDTLEINLLEIYNEGDFEQDVFLQQGDQIFVPFLSSLNTVALLLPDGGRLGVPYDSNATIQDYFTKAGMNRMHNMGYQSLTIRYPDKTAKVISISEMSHTKLSPQVEVEFLVTPLFVYVGGSLASMGKVPYNSSWHAIDYLAASGITFQTGTWSQVRVIRGENQEEVSLNVSTDPIFPGDYIEIPRSRYETFKDATMFVASLLSILSTALIIYTTFQ